MAGRIAALLAMVVLFGGKTVHVHQESCDCSVSEESSEVVSSESACDLYNGCPFGCDDCHTSSPEESDTNDEPHEEHQCAVCSVLAQSLDQVVFTILTTESALVADVVAIAVEAPAEGFLLQPKTRGPPINA